MIALVDVDDTVADLMTEWVRRYNADYDDTLTPQSFVQWDCTRIVKPECGARFYEYLKQPDLYDYVLPMRGALSGVNTLRTMGYRVVFVTSCGIDHKTIGASAGAKLQWLLCHDFLKNKADYVIAEDKTLLLGDVLIDDRLTTANTFPARAVMPARPHNDPACHRVAPHVRRCATWSQIVEAVADVW